MQARPASGPLLPTNNINARSNMLVDILDRRLRVLSPLTMEKAGAIVDAGRPALKGGEVTVDLSALPGADSSALAALFAWQREQQRQGGTLRVSGAPQGLLALAALYGVNELLVWA
jgi:phospholipid transport system transporter-binding protein